MNAIAFTPYITIERDGMIPAKFVPVARDGNCFYEGEYSKRSVINSVYSMADVLSEFNVSDCAETLLREIVLAVVPVINTYCGGTCLVWVSTLNKSKARMFGSCAGGFYISEDDDGVRRIAYPA